MVMGAGIAMQMEGLLRGLEQSVAPANFPYRAVLNDLSVYLAGRAKESFENSAAPDGTKWAALKRPRNRTRDKRASGGTGQKPLRDRDILMASATGQGPNGVRNFGPTWLEQGSKLNYAGPQNYGAKINKPEQVRPYPKKPFVFEGPEGRRIFARRIRAHTVTIPARPFLGLTDQDGSRMAQIAAERVRMTLRRALP
jgi:phage gpG-like protein